MPYLGNILAGNTIQFRFNTEAGGAPAPFDDTPVVSVFEDDDPSPITAGVTVTENFAGLVGLHSVAVDSSAVGYGAAHNYTAVLTYGLVGGLDRAGLILGEFSIENRYSSGGGVVDFAEVLAAIAAVKAKTDLIVLGDITVRSPFNPKTDRLELTRGDDYPLNNDGFIPPFTSSDWPDLDGAEVRMTARRNPLIPHGAEEVLMTLLDDPDARINESGFQSVSFEPMSLINKGSDQEGSTDLLIPGRGTVKWDIQATLEDGTIRTLLVGLMDVIEDQTRPA